ncbi:hypothetical protein IFM89_033369 [Coptis chinensis]|uniref:AAA+ ATPase domain-containing protein n=1 Tax=Coptis chinensis TaxID=261450 RepID=A0A835HGL0_9MAGN|nr:hypothetical protein IFM89_033369 [Coptis chinensis]
MASADGLDSMSHSPVRDTDVMLMIVGIVAALANGLSTPLMTYLIGDIIDSFGQNADNKDLVREVSKYYSNETNTGDSNLIHGAIGEKVPSLPLNASHQTEKSTATDRHLFPREQRWHLVDKLPTPKSQAGNIVEQTINSIITYLWFGSRMILENKGYTGGDVVNIILAMLTGSLSLAQASPCLNSFASGKSAASKMFKTINRKPQIDASDTSGHIMDDICGDIELRDVYFSYPARPDEQIFSGFSLCMPNGTTTALVGQSGSGKSTVVSLIERFYDPQAGEVLIDAYGKEGATLEEIVAASGLANATKFIDKLPQRVAIARAILKEARILLLDEATSALDMESERIVQEALERIMVQLNYCYCCPSLEHCEEL